MTEAEFKQKAENFWVRAHQIAKFHPEVDASDVYHAFWCLDLPPIERLIRGLMREPAKSHAVNSDEV